MHLSIEGKIIIIIYEKILCGSQSLGEFQLDVSWLGTSFGCNSSFLQSEGSEEVVVLKVTGHSRARCPSFSVHSRITLVGFGGQSSFSHLYWHTQSQIRPSPPVHLVYPALPLRIAIVNQATSQLLEKEAEASGSFCCCCCCYLFVFCFSVSFSIINGPFQSVWQKPFQTRKFLRYFFIWIKFQIWKDVVGIVPGKTPQLVLPRWCTFPYLFCFMSQACAR